MIIAFVALMLLRMVIGFHFFQEGTEKLRAGNFDAGPFLSQAKGPLAPMFHGMLDDPHGHWRLCVKDKDDFGNPDEPTIDTEITFAIWKHFVSESAKRYRFDDPLMLDVFEKQLSNASDPTKQSAIASKIDRIKKQPKRSIKILEDHKLQLNDFLAVNRDKILAYARSSKRLDGFERDGENRKQVIDSVASLQGQVDSIARERTEPLRNWYASIDNIWNSLEAKINELAIEDQKPQQGKLTQPIVKLHRPYDLDINEFSKHKLINAIIPWFDTILGALLLIGLFTRFASLAGAIFLLSVVLSQPFWVHGTIETWLQWIEMFALLALFATCAGRYGGLDFFLHRLFGKRQNVAVSANVIDN